MQSRTRTQGKTKFGFSSGIFKGSVVYENTSQEIIQTTADKLRLSLRNYKDILARIDWRTPAALFLSVLTTLVTARFIPAFGIDAAIWNAIYIFVLLGSFIAVLLALINAYKYRNSTNIENMVEEIKHGRKNALSKK